MEGNDVRPESNDPSPVYINVLTKEIKKSIGALTFQLPVSHTIVIPHKNTGSGL